jgi:hypothetical protein
MGIVSGDITEITINHPAIGGTKVWFPKANTDSTFDPGGIRTNDDQGAIDGGGRKINQKNRVGWELECTLGWDMNSTNELDTAEKLAASPVDADMTISHINGTVWAGKGTVQGDIKGNGNTGELPIKLGGGGKLTKIVG